MISIDMTSLVGKVIEMINVQMSTLASLSSA